MKPKYTFIVSSILTHKTKAKNAIVCVKTGGVKTLFDIAPSFVANGNYNFGDDLLPVCTHIVNHLI